MFNADNLKELERLEAHKFNYIVGSRIKNTPKALQQQILKTNNYNKINDQILLKCELDIFLNWNFKTIL